jgi:hypothetical protein
MRHSFELILILRETLKRLEQESTPNDPAFLKLKSTMLQAIADLESSRERENDEQCA